MERKRRPTNRRRSRRSPEHLPPAPHFIKIALPLAIEVKAMRIPNKFLETYGFELSNIATLSVPSGREWQIQVKREMNDVWFDAGWHDFVERYSIKEWNILVFRYEGRSKFQVLIFDDSCCEINYLRHHVETSSNESGDEGSSDLHGTETRKERRARTLKCEGKAVSSGGLKCKSGATEKPPEVVELDSSDSEFNMREKRNGSAPKSVRREGMGSKRSHLEQTRNENFRIIKVNSNRIAQAATQSNTQNDIAGKEIIATMRNFPDPQSLKIAMLEAIKLKLENPSFIIILKRYHFVNYSMCVPIEFVRRHMREAAEFINIEDPRGRQWPVHVLKDGFILGRGWYDLFDANNCLKEGDTCVLELKETKPNIVLKLFVINPLYGR